jgi:hypothetical protein
MHEHVTEGMSDFNALKALDMLVSYFGKTVDFSVRLSKIHKYLHIVQKTNKTKGLTKKVHKYKMRRSIFTPSSFQHLFALKIFQRISLYMIIGTQDGPT